MRLLRQTLSAPRRRGWLTSGGHAPRAASVRGGRHSPVPSCTRRSHAPRRRPADCATARRLGDAPISPLVPRVAPGQRFRPQPLHSGRCVCFPPTSARAASLRQARLPRRPRIFQRAALRRVRRRGSRGWREQFRSSRRRERTDPAPCRRDRAVVSRRPASAPRSRVHPRVLLATAQQSAGWPLPSCRIRFHFPRSGAADPVAPQPQRSEPAAVDRRRTTFQHHRLRRVRRSRLSGTPYS